MKWDYLIESDEELERQKRLSAASGSSNERSLRLLARRGFGYYEYLLPLYKDLLRHLTRIRPWFPGPVNDIEHQEAKYGQLRRESLLRMFHNPLVYVHVFKYDEKASRYPEGLNTKILGNLYISVEWPRAIHQGRASFDVGAGEVFAVVSGSYTEVKAKSNNSREIVIFKNSNKKWTDAGDLLGLLLSTGRMHFLNKALPDKVLSPYEIELKNAGIAIGSPEELDFLKFIQRSHQTAVYYLPTDDIKKLFAAWRKQKK